MAIGRTGTEGSSIAWKRETVYVPYVSRAEMNGHERRLKAAAGCLCSCRKGGSKQANKEKEPFHGGILSSKASAKRHRSCQHYADGSLCGWPVYF